MSHPSKFFLLLFCALYGCASTPTPTLYESLGGQPGIEQIVHELILEIADDDVVRPHFRTIDIAGFRHRLEDFLCVVAGGLVSTLGVPCATHMLTSQLTVGPSIALSSI